MYNRGDTPPPPLAEWRPIVLLAAGLLVGGAVMAKACSPVRNPPRARGDAVRTVPTTTSPHTAAVAPTTAPTTAPLPSSQLPPLDPKWKPPPPPPDQWGDNKKWKGSFEAQNELLLEQLRAVHHLSVEQLTKLQQLMTESKRIGQGDPTVTRHPVSPNECRKKMKEEKITYAKQRFEQICGARYMAPLYNPKTQRPQDAKVCIDQFEFPNIPCTYPVTWVRANEVAAICEIIGKRICDAHEWEGACYGELTPPDYNFGIPKRMGWKDGVERMRVQHNINVYNKRRHAYGGARYQRGVCATGSQKSRNCGVGWGQCGSNTYPTGFFPACTSSLAVYDLHGNAAEHMNLPLAPEQLASAKHSAYGRTEMKGSWFIFDTVQAHEDYCRWRAPHWHGTRILNKKSHRNYHLGFRCCKSL